MDSTSWKVIVEMAPVGHNFITYQIKTTTLACY